MFSKYLNYYYSEELVTRVIKEYDDNVYEISVFKNPNSVSRMAGSVRGVLTKDGDLFVVDYEIIKESGRPDYNAFIHEDLLWILAGKGLVPIQYKKFKYDEINKSIYDFLLVEKKKNTKDTFILGESYFKTKGFWERYTKRLGIYANKAKEKNPQFEFKFEPLT